jgi:hypothetical protein
LVGVAEGRLRAFASSAHTRFARTAARNVLFEQAELQVAVVEAAPVVKVAGGVASVWPAKAECLHRCNRRRLNGSGGTEMYRLLSDALFITEFEPEQDEKGEYYRQRSWTNHEDMLAVHATPPACVWTYMDDGDRGTMLGDGMHFVNRLFYVLTAKPCPPGDQIEVDDLCECGRRQLYCRFNDDHPEHGDYPEEDEGMTDE